MHGSAAIVVIIGLAVAQAALAAGGPEGIEFREPRGWTKATQPNGCLGYQPPQVPARMGCSVAFMPPGQGEIAQHFDQTWRRTAAGVKVVSGGQVVAGKTAACLPTRSVTAVVDAGGQRTWMHFFAFQSGPRVEMVLYAANDEALFEKHLPEVRAMFDSIRPAGAEAKADQGNPAPAPAAKTPAGRAPAPPPLERGKTIDGVFYLAKVAFNPAGGPGARAARTDYLCFSPDGLVYSGAPVGGPVALFADPDDSPDYGRYTPDGDAFTIAWNFDKTLNRRITHRGRRLADGTVEVNGEVYRPLPACNDLKLDGTYSWKWGGGESVVRFTPDGRFTEHGLRETVTDDDRVHPDWPRMPPRGAGKYAIRSNTLELQYDGGPTRRIFFTTRDDPKDVRSISINSYPHEKAR
jgi:hypothetical protein